MDKTHNLEFPLLPVDMYPHYIRGHFDGDGCFTEFFTSRPMASMNVFITSGSYSFLLDLATYVRDLGITKGVSIAKKAANCWHISYSVNDSHSFLNYIYCNNTIDNHRLERKYLKYERIIVNGIRAKRSDKKDERN